MSEAQHAKDLKKLKGHTSAGSPTGTGGACLNRHLSQVKESDSCSHRWQGYLNAKANAEDLYDWPHYKPLSEQSSITTSARMLNGTLFPDWYRKTLKPPKKGDWDVGKDGNFRTKCYVPYWHNAHHVIPNSELRKAILEVGKGMRAPLTTAYLVRQGLLDEKYNLNFKKNMIMLPMDRTVGGTLQLPVHLKSPTARSHGAYSKNVANELKTIFTPVQAALDEHEEEPKYKACKDDLENLSEHLHSQIVAAGKSGTKYIDQMAASLFPPPPA